MKIIPIVTHRLVKSEDLNHHGTLFAGRTAEWFVESGFMSAATYIPAKSIVCVKVHDMVFTRPVALGETIRFISKVVLTGRTSLVSSIHVSVREQEILNGFITFVSVDEYGHPLPHGVELEYENGDDIVLAERAKTLKKG